MKSMTSSINSCDCVKAIDKVLTRFSAGASFRINELWDLTVPVPWKRTEENTAPVNDIRLHIVRGGRGRYMVNGEWFPMSKGLIMFFHPPLYFGHEADPDDPPSLISCHFDLIANGSGDLLRKEADGFFWTSQLSIEEYEKVLPFFDKVSELHQEKSGRKFQDALSSSALHQLLGIIQKLCLSMYSDAFDPRIEAARLHMDKNPMDSRSLSALAAEFGLGQDYFTRLFHKQLGTSPKAYRLKSRMNYARYLLGIRNDVKSVAYELGYSDQFVFSRLFKKVHGFSPSSLKRQ